MKKILMLVNTYNPRNNTYNYKVWKRMLVSLIIQRKDDLHVDIAIVDDISHQDGRDLLLVWQKQVPDLYLDFIDSRYSVHVCLNHVTHNLRNNNYDWIGNCSSDILWTNPDDLSTLISDAELNSDCVMISPQISTDMNLCFPQFIKHGDFPPSMLKVPETVNGHCYIRHKSLMEAYDYKTTDILWGQGTESIFGYSCAAIRKREYISHRVRLDHNIAAMERVYHGWYDKPYETWGSKEKFLKMIESGKDIGIGFEELYFYTKDIPGLIYIAPDSRAHNPDAYDEDKFPKTDELYHFIKKNLYLTKEQLDYDKLPAKIYDPVIKT